MKTYTKQTIKKEYDVLDKIICDCCGKKIDEFKEYVDIKKSFGYFAEVFADGDELHIDICEHCFEKWLLTFKNVPKPINNMQ